MVRARTTACRTHVVPYMCTAHLACRTVVTTTMKCDLVCVLSTCVHVGSTQPSLEPRQQARPPVLHAQHAVHCTTAAACSTCSSKCYRKHACSSCTAVLVLVSACMQCSATALPGVLQPAQHVVPCTAVSACSTTAAAPRQQAARLACW